MTPKAPDGRSEGIRKVLGMSKKQKSQYWKNVESNKRNTSIYSPRQGEQEKARRRRQIDEGIIKVTG